MPMVDTTAWLFTAMCSVVCAFLGVDGLSFLYAAYTKAVMKLEDEAWLLNQCKEPHFFSKMRAHTTICNDVAANARVGALMTALREVTEVFRISWEPWLTTCAMTLSILLPVCWVCTARLSRRRYDLPTKNLNF